MIDKDKLAEMVERSIQRRYDSNANSECPLIAADMEDGAEYERNRICLLLHQEIPGLKAREDHDGGPSLTTLIEELIEKIRR